MTKTSETYLRPSLVRHLAAMLYDSLLLLSVLLLATAVAVMFNSGDAIGRGNPFFLVYLLAIAFLFYGWFWIHGGQTLGMRSWKIFIVSSDGSSITWQQAFVRFAIALISWLPAGLGFWWQYLGRDNQSWPDMLSQTQLVYKKDSENKPLSRLS